MYKISFLFLILTLGVCQCTNAGENLVDFIKSRSIDLATSADLDPLILEAGDRKLVLLGEASHGTHEYYIWRDSISRRLIGEHNFSFIAVEGDFTSLFELNRYVKNMPGAASSAREVLMGLTRWPLWMWGNQEVEGLVEWLREFNDPLPQEQKVGFYGMDVYDEWRSKDAVLEVLQKFNPEIYAQVKQKYECFAGFDRDSWRYAQSVQQGGNPCNEQTGRVVELLQNSRDRLGDISDYEYFFLLQNARVKQNAEKFYRKSLTRQDASSWNSRVHHMHNTVNYLLDFYGDNSKGIVWAHNTHVGDARFTEMYTVGNQNIGELSRVHHGPENVFSVGFTTYTGRVVAGASWESRMQTMRISSARRGSVEYIFNQTENESFYMLFDDTDRTHDAFMQAMGHRAIGVVFNPANEPRQYVNTIVPLRYDAFIFFNTTRGLNSLHR